MWVYFAQLYANKFENQNKMKIRQSWNVESNRNFKAITGKCKPQNVGATILTSNTIDVRVIKLTEDLKGHYIQIKGQYTRMM